MPARPNAHHPNSDDCVLMSCADGQYDWRDVSCSESHMGNNSASFICQTNQIDVSIINMVG